LAARAGQARRAAEKPLAGQIAVVTGAGGAIGAATAKAFAAAAPRSRCSISTRRGPERSQGGQRHGARGQMRRGPTPRRCGPPSTRWSTTFGGVDIVVSNAGAAWQGRIGEVDEEILRKSFELNFYGHQRVAQAAVKIMLAQSTGGCLLFNVSKQAVNPDPISASMDCRRRRRSFSSAIRARLRRGRHPRQRGHADRIRSGLLTDAFIAERSRHAV
jgi:NAD(P)-dependent dehydrogenase (short-subunit alcohol dehydrogenase family)